MPPRDSVNPVLIPRLTPQLLGEFAELCGPFSVVLATLRDELLKAVYSWHYASERGGLSFDQLPWFSVAERLERDKEAMLEEREAFKRQMLEQQEAVSRIEDQMQAMRRATDVAQLDAATVRSQLERLVISEESSRLEVSGREGGSRTLKAGPVLVQESPCALCDLVTLVTEVLASA